MLDDFSAFDLREKTSNHPVLKTDKIQQQSHDQAPSDIDAAEFSKQLQEQMAALMGEVDETPEMKREIEAMMQELGTEIGSAGGSRGQKDTKPLNPSEGEKTFQEKIQGTMERMQASGDQAASAGVQDDPDNIFAELLQEMQGDGFEGGRNEEEFSKMLTGMMEQLTNKDILYEPMAELHEKFPKWMSENKDKTNKDDLKRYQEQQRIVEEIVSKFNEKKYSDSKASDREFIVDRMQQVRRSL